MTLAGLFCLVSVFGFGQLTVNTLSVIDESCEFACDGSVHLDATGGDGNYTYDIGIASNTSGVFLNLCPGTYFVMVTDGLGATGNTSFTINAAIPANLSVSTTDESCNGFCDGTIAIQDLSGNMAQYSIDGITYQTSPSFPGLCPGSYTINYQTINGCFGIWSTEVINGGATITVSSSVINQVTCNGTCDGAATVSASGGSGTITCDWFDGVGNYVGSGSTLTNLCADSYSIICTDANGCQGGDFVLITEPVAIVSNSVPTDATCFGVCDGSIDLNTTGGTPPYMVTIDGGVSFTSYTSTTSLTGLCAMTYSVEIYDANGCLEAFFVTINEPTQINVSTSVVALDTNNNCTGEMSSNVTGGTPPYSYVWYDCGTSSPVSTSTNASGLCVGSYQLVITDVNGCTNQAPCDSITSIIVCGVGMNDVITNVTCAGDCDGSISVFPINANGGIYVWSNGDTSSSISGLCAGTYCLDFEDINGCEFDTCYTIVEPTTLSLMLDSSSNETGVGTGDGAIYLSASGGVPAYQFSIDGGLSYQASSDFTGLSAGTYQICVIDVNGCETCDSVVISAPNSIKGFDHVQVNLFPNPNNGHFQLSVQGLEHQSKLLVLDQTGRVVHSTSILNGFNSVEIDNISSGIYQLVLSSQDSKTTLPLVIRLDLNCIFVGCECNQLY